MKKTKSRKRVVLKLILRAFFTALGWVLLTSAFGLIQLWIMIGIALYVERVEDTIRSLMLNGGVLFFIMALVTSIATDYYFDQSISLPRWLEGIIFLVFPLITGIYVSYSYTAFFFLKEQNINYAVVSLSQQLALIWTVLYALVAKFIQFLEPSWRSIR